MIEKRSRGKDTRANILEASRLQFNRNGLHATAVYKIAGDLAISAGNLSYHFKSKGEIIAALADDLDKRIEEASQPFVQPLAGEEFICAMEIFLTVLWKFRCFFNSSHDLGGISTDLAVRHVAVRQRIRSLIRRSTGQVIDQGRLAKPRSPNSAGIIADNIVSIWIAWLQETVPDPGAEDQPSPQMLRDCVEHHFGVIESYVSNKFLESFRASLERHYGR